MRKFLCVFLLALCFVGINTPLNPPLTGGTGKSSPLPFHQNGIAYAEEVEPIEIGFLARLRTTPQEFFGIISNAWATKGWAILGGDHSVGTARFYDSLMQMQMALNRREIEEMILPDFVANYMLHMNKSYTPSCISYSGRMSLCFGFAKKNRELALQWNAALNYLRNNYILAGLENKYVKNFSEENSNYDYIYGTNTREKKKKDAIRFQHFEGARTIRVAVTGDLPPVDYVAEDGTPAGYNAAVLSEIGKVLRVNIMTLNVSAGARTAALVSGRADVVFWYEVNNTIDFQPDVPDDVILSEPYLSWDTFMHLRFNE